MKVCVVAEFYPSDRDPVLGVWAHRQAVAAREAGAEVRVVVLHRLVPPAASVRDGSWRREVRARMREPRAQERDGVPVVYVPYFSPPRSRVRPKAVAPRQLRTASGKGCAPTPRNTRGPRSRRNGAIFSPLVSRPSK